MFFRMLFFVFALAGCQPSDFPHVEKQKDGTTAFTGHAMTMHYKILVGQELSPEKTKQVAEIITTTFHDTDTIFNKWNPLSELSRLNSQNAEVKTPLSPDLLRLFQEADYVFRLSQGKFDPTIEPLNQLWKQKLEMGGIPSSEEIQNIASTIGWNKISFANGVFSKKNDHTQLDFGGIAKGLCIDMLVERLHASGMDNVFVEWGGEIRANGQHPQDRPWMVYISRLDDNDPEHALATFPLNDQAIATSGDYLQNWSVNLSDSDGKKRAVTYFHIYDPQTLHPLQATYTSVASTSVIAPTCALADGLATAAMMFATQKEAKEWTETIKDQFSEISFWIISRSDLP